MEWDDKVVIRSKLRVGAGSQVGEISVDDKNGVSSIKRGLTS